MGNLASMSDAFFTPKHKDGYTDYTGSPRHQKRINANLQAPKKGGVLLSDDSGSCRKGAHQAVYSDADS